MTAAASRIALYSISTESAKTAAAWYPDHSPQDSFAFRARWRSKKAVPTLTMPSVAPGAQAPAPSGSPDLTAGQGPLGAGHPPGLASRRPCAGWRSASLFDDPVSHGTREGAMPQRFDAVVIGGGHNGLVAAAYLAKAGRRVLVLER